MLNRKRDMEAPEPRPRHRLRGAIFWILAVIITLAAAVYQKTTGPTYPLSGTATLGGTEFAYELPRSHDVGDAPVALYLPDAEVQGVISYKRLNVAEPRTEIPLERRGDSLAAALPHQPPAGKLEYYVRLTRGDQVTVLPADPPEAVIRFKGAVPAWALAPHVLFIFLAMLVSNRAGLEALPATGRPRRYAWWTAGLLLLGGMVFGPIVQKYAFGAFWTGIPWGWDLTDNKTLIAMLGWLVPLWAMRGGRSARGWVLFAALLMLVVFSIPHSMLGSELDYATGEVGTSGVDP
ncbi:MAG: hypothetical protein C4524_15330 [Candidatus Zixiibacteriota bacterium]|nr:MAG: hypothetical protein C4524_15330 [candidate division Zixibacteria bacterium]